MSKATDNFFNKVNPNLILWGLGIAAGYNYVLVPLLESLHLKKSDTQLANEAAPVIQNNPWSINFYKSAPGGSALLTTAVAKDYAYQLYEYPGIFFDSYNTVLGVFQKLRTKTQVSFLADIFQQEYKQSLYGYLQDGGGILPWDGLSEINLATINKLVNNLPDYKA